MEHIFYNLGLSLPGEQRPKNWFHIGIQAGSHFYIFYLLNFHSCSSEKVQNSKSYNTVSAQTSPANPTKD